MRRNEQRKKEVNRKKDMFRNEERKKDVNRKM